MINFNTPLAQLQLALSANINNAHNVCHWTRAVIDTGAWREFPTFSEFAKSIGTDIFTVWLLATSEPKARAALRSVLQPEEFDYLNTRITEAITAIELRRLLS